MNATQTKNMRRNLQVIREAKDNVKAWTDWQIQAEKSVLEELKAQGVTFPTSGSIELEDEAVILFVQTRTWDQGCLASFVARHPDQEGVTICKEWKPVAKEKVDNFMASRHPGAAELKDCFTEKGNKPSFRVK